MVLGVDIETFRDEFSQRCRKKRDEFSKRCRREQAKGKRDLLAWQRKRGKKGSDRMLIWMGQQHLEQSDRQALEHSGSIKRIPRKLRYKS